MAARRGRPAQVAAWRLCSPFAFTDAMTGAAVGMEGSILLTEGRWCNLVIEAKAARRRGSGTSTSSTPKTVTAVTRDGCILSSTDGGHTWHGQQSLHQQESVRRKLFRPRHGHDRRQRRRHPRHCERRRQLAQQKPSPVHLGGLLLAPAGSNYLIAIVLIVRASPPARSVTK